MCPHFVTVLVKMGESLPCIAEPDAMPALLCVNQPRPRIPNAHVQLIPIANSRGLHQPLVLAMSDPMPDRILHNRLQQKARDQAIDRGRVYVDLDTQPVRESHLFDRPIVPD
jgi:hypothetical protein